LRSGIDQADRPPGIVHAITGVLLASRGVLAAVFVAAAAGKLLDRAGTREAFRAFGAPEGWEGAWPALVAAELLVAVGLIIPASAVVAAAGALVLLAMFCAAVGRLMRRGESPDCHCFGQLHSEPAGPRTLIRNALLAAPAVCVLAAGPGASFTHAFGQLSGTQAALVAVAAFAAALIIVCAQLTADRRALAAQLAEARTAKPPPGLPRGTPAPELVLTPLRDHSGSLTELREPGESAVVVFLSAGCQPCRALAPQLARWQDTVELTIVPIFSGPPAAVEALVEETGLSLALRQAAGEASAAYNLRQTPAAITVGPHGQIASAPAIGAPAIEALIRAALASRGPAPQAGPIPVPSA
jgi:hypothetical protein